MMRIQKLCDIAFNDMTETEKMMSFATPKLLRLVEIFKEYINLPRRKSCVVVSILFPFRLFNNNFCFKVTKEPHLGRVPRPIV